MKTRRLLSQTKKKFVRSSQPSLNNLDQKLQKYLDFEGGFFIEAGANDGYTQSNTYYLEKKRAWTGVLVEGIPALFDKCRSERENAAVFNFALVSEEFNEPFITMHFADLMSTVDSSFGTVEETKQHINRGIEVQHLDSTYSVEVPTSTLSSVLDLHGETNQIDFLSLDVEGYELSVLEGIDFDRHRPTYILVEARKLDLVDKHLVKNGYRMVEQMTYHDYLYSSH